MIIQKISATNSAFGLKLGTKLQKDIDNSRIDISSHVNKNSLNPYFNSNIKYLKTTLPDGELDLIKINSENGSKEYKISDGKGKSVPIFVNGADLCYGKLKRKIIDLRTSGDFRQKHKVTI